MDIYCPRCAEPFDIDTLHDVASEIGSTFGKVRDDFFRRGCGLAFSESSYSNGGGACEKVNDVRADASSALYDILGDDIDGIASMLDDVF